MDNFIKSINKMKILKKIWLLLAWFSIIFGINFNSCWALDGGSSLHPEGYTGSNPSVNEIAVDGSWSTSQWINTFTNELSGIINNPDNDSYNDSYNTSLWKAIKLIQIAINRILWILALVALVYMLYNWFLVLTSWTESKNADKGKKWISTAAIALAWIGLSWLIVSAIIWLIKFVSN